MHELGYCEALLPAVERRAAGRPVRRIGIRAGTRHRLVAEVMQMAWTETAQDTAFADAETVLNETPMQAQCAACEHRFPTDDTLAECPRCGVVGPRLSGGDEFVLEWLEFVDGHDVLGEAVGSPDPDEHDHHDHHDHQDHHDTDRHERTGGGG